MDPNEICIVDYGMANLRSVQKALESVGHHARISSDPREIGAARKVILPGVGAFRDAIRELRNSHLDQVILEHIHKDRPILGICLGLQMLFSRSFEEGTHTGLDVFPGDVVRFADPLVGKSGETLKVPHMGWNPLRFTRSDCPLFKGLPDNPSVYFVHSYYAAPVDPNLVIAEADYPVPFAAAIWKKNIYATQFHPEKSQSIGLKMLKNFAEL